MGTIDRVRATSLPPEYTSFVGRRADLKAVRAAVEGARLLTLVGPGGVGKTRLAIQLANAVKRVLPDGIWFVDLGRLAVGGSVADEAVRMLGLRTDSTDKTDVLIKYLSDLHGLLLLDNCEHVLDDAARVVQRVLDACPGVMIVTTSRETFRLVAETVFVVAPLETVSTRGAVSPAAQLFLDRAAVSLPNPTPSELSAIAAICERLGGMPLAIELAASRTRALSPAQILERLSEPLGVLTGATRDAPERQQTLRTTIAWSYDLCTPAERELWRRMSVFVGGWDFEAAEWMCTQAGGAESALDLVQSLLDKSIIARRGRGAMAGFAMLDTVRIFGLDVSSAAELSQARRLHRDWYQNRLAALEAEWYGPRQAYWLAYTQLELPNIRAAVDFCLEEHDLSRAATILMSGWRVVWQAHGRSYEVQGWMSLVVSFQPPPETTDVCQAMAFVASVEGMHGDHESAERRWRLAEEAAERLGDDFTRAFVAATQGSQERDPDLRLAHTSRASILQGGRNLAVTRANIEERLALAHDHVGHARVAEELRRKLIAQAIEAGDSFETAELLLKSGWLAATREEFDAARGLVRQSLSLTQNLEHSNGIAGAQEVLALIAARSHDYVRAATLLGITRPSAGMQGAFASAFPYDAESLSVAEQHAKAALGDRAFEAAFAAGAAMTADQGIAYALGAELPQRRRPASAAAGVGLTPRESQVVALVGQGLTDRQIAERLVISRRTAEGHVSNSLVKLGFTSRSQLAAWSTQSELD
ncbi:ATP-binding protein [Leifsonia sp. McL0607]|uniref:ATP-binding protein n=1 Tax=Leifsonia sp. McL0607 TaxID=3415672 RepID=UPI003CF82B4E